MFVNRSPTVPPNFCVRSKIFCKWYNANCYDHLSAHFELILNERNKRWTDRLSVSKMFYIQKFPRPQRIFLRRLNNFQFWNLEFAYPAWKNSFHFRENPLLSKKKGFPCDLHSSTFNNSNLPKPRRKGQGRASAARLKDHSIVVRNRKHTLKWRLAASRRTRCEPEDPPALISLP